MHLEIRHRTFTCIHCSHILTYLHFSALLCHSFYSNLEKLYGVQTSAYMHNLTWVEELNEEPLGSNRSFQYSHIQATWCPITFTTLCISASRGHSGSCQMLFYSKACSIADLSAAMSYAINVKTFLHTELTIKQALK